MASAIITAPKSAKRGEIIEIRALVQHPMETGYRRSSDGDLLLRDLVRRFECRFVAEGRNAASDSGEVVFTANLHAAIAANPYLSFNLRAMASGTLVFTWSGDKGFSQREPANLQVA